jgi:hypothetical protein
MLVRALSILLTLSLGACSISGLLPDWTSTDVAGPEPAYRFIIANALQPIVGDPAKAGTLEISSGRRVDSLKGASWVVCIKAQKFPLLPQYYAVFFQGGRIVDNRLSVLIDQCELQSYTAFNWAADANAPPAR